MTVAEIKNELTEMRAYALQQKNFTFKTYKQGYLKAIEDLCRFITQTEYLESLNPPEDPPALDYTEFRCCICKDRNECPAYNTGVVFPCEHFEEEKHGTEE